MRVALALTVASAFVLAPDSNAQGVPYGDYIIGIFGNNTTTMPFGEGLVLYRRGAAAVGITGLTAAGRADDDVGAVQIDPVNGDIWLGGFNDSGLGKITLAANNTVSSWTPWGNATTTGTGGSSIAAIAFDDLGNPMVASGLNVFQFNRNAVASPVSIAQSSNTSTVNAICRDKAGNLYYGQTDGTLWFMAENNSLCTYNAPLMLGSTMPPSSSATISGVEAAPNGSLYWTDFGGGFGQFVLPGGPATTSSTAVAFNDLEYDVDLGDFALVTATQGSGDTYIGTTSLAINLDVAIPGIGANGAASSIDTCDIADGDMKIVPVCVPRPGGVINLEMAMKAPPGTVAAIFISSAVFGLPTTTLVVCPTSPSNGRCGFAANNLFIPDVATLPQQSLFFTPAYLDTGTNQVTVGTTVAWPQN